MQNWDYGLVLGSVLEVLGLVSGIPSLFFDGLLIYKLMYLFLILFVLLFCLHV